MLRHMTTCSTLEGTQEDRASVAEQAARVVKSTTCLLMLLLLSLTLADDVDVMRLPPLSLTDVEAKGEEGEGMGDAEERGAVADTHEQPASMARGSPEKAQSHVSWRPTWDPVC